MGHGLSITRWIKGARVVDAARGQVIFVLAPFVGAVLAWPLVGEQLRGRVLVAFVISLVGVLVVGTARHHHVYTHEMIEHAYALDLPDIHHRHER